MADYQVTVSTSHLDNAGTFNHVFIKLVGTDGESERTRLVGSKGESSFTRGSVSTFTVSCPVSIGKLVMIELEKQPSQNLDKWFPTKVGVKSPEGDTFKFLICRWITDSEVHRFREGREPDEHPFRKPNIRPSVLEADISSYSIYSRNTDLKVSRFRERTDIRFAQGTYLLDQSELLAGQRDALRKYLNKKTQEAAAEGPSLTPSSLPKMSPAKAMSSNTAGFSTTSHYFSTSREPESAHIQLLSLPFFGWFEDQEEDYRWHKHAKGIPHCMKAAGQCSLPNEVWFSLSKITEFHYNAAAGLGTLKLRGLADSKENWTDIDEINGVFWHNETDISDYVQKHWKEDALFAYQFLNGVNPMLIRRCSALPENFPVTDNMVFPDGQFSLADEMEKGNIFLCDYKRLDGLKANIINDKQQYLMAPLVLLHKTPDDKLMPIAIQLKQTPAEDNPIFLPTDSEYDWLTAKIFVRSADFNEHQVNAHLLRTHLLAEVFAVSLLRNVPRTHSLYKLLVPHTRDTLHINVLARDKLISKTGVFTKIAASGGEGMITLLQRSLSSVTYSSLCIPDDIAERGLEDVPNFYYRDDGLKLWDIIHRFVQGVLGFYYKNDDKVQEDSKLQKWIQDIYEHGFLSQEGTGIPQRFTTVEELVKFVTMVIFTCSAQHSAVNTGQFEYGGWMPNFPSSLQHAPPTKKGTTSEATMMDTLPDKGTTAHGMATLWLLSQQFYDFVGLGESLEDYQSDEIPRKLIKDFQEELKVLSANIKTRNESLKIPYTYMDPAVMENSVAI